MRRKPALINILVYIVGTLALLVMITAFPADERIESMENRSINRLNINAETLVQGKVDEVTEGWLGDRVGYRFDVVVLAREIREIAALPVPAPHYEPTPVKPPTVAPSAGTITVQIEPPKTPLPDQSTAPNASIGTDPQETPVPTAVPQMPQFNDSWGSLRGAKFHGGAGGVLVFDDSAAEISANNSDRMRLYAGAVNAFAAKLTKKRNNIRVFNLVAPMRIAFLPREITGVYGEQEVGIAGLYNGLLGVTAVDAYTEISQHLSEYVYFRTDHHWTQLGAYYAYVAFCTQADLTPVPLYSLVPQAYEGLLGTLYGQEPRRGMKEWPDTLVYYRDPNVITDRSLFNAPPKDKKPYYTCFIGSDQWKQVFNTNTKNGRVAVLIKDSYGNAFAPFLMAHYEVVIVMDPRHGDSSIADMILREYECDCDVIFLNNYQAVNTATWTNLIKKIL